MKHTKFYGMKSLLYMFHPQNGRNPETILKEYQDTFVITMYKD
jgi:hypothetical protein